MRDASKLEHVPMTFDLAFEAPHDWGQSIFSVGEMIRPLRV